VDVGGVDAVGDQRVNEQPPEVVVADAAHHADPLAQPSRGDCLVSALASRRAQVIATQHRLAWNGMVRHRHDEVDVEAADDSDSCARHVIPAA